MSLAEAMEPSAIHGCDMSAAPTTPPAGRIDALHVHLVDSGTRTGASKDNSHTWMLAEPISTLLRVRWLSGCLEQG